MKVFQTEQELIIKENPGCLWLFGLFFALFGILFIYGAYSGYVLFGINSPWAVYLTFLTGFAGICLGGWLIYLAPIHNLSIDKKEQRVSLTSWGIFGRKTEFYKFAEIDKFLLLEEDGFWSFGLELVNGKKIPITSLGKHPEDYQDKYVYPINVFIGKEMPTCQLNFAVTDESGDKLE